MCDMAERGLDAAIALSVVESLLTVGKVVGMFAGSDAESWFW